jgi:hypothetical protein
MRQSLFWTLLGVLTMTSYAAEADKGGGSAKGGTFGTDVAFLKAHTDVTLLARGDAQVAVAAAYQGRVMTSTTGGEGGPSFGWLNRKVIEAGILSAEARKGKLEDHIYVFGGEERFWLGPEGGQFALYFAPGAKFVFDDWHTPAAIDTEPFEIMGRTETSVLFSRECTLVNYSGTQFKIGIRRSVSLLDDAEIDKAIGGVRPAGLKAVAYETDNRIANKGDKPWTKQTGLLSIWLLGMYNPGPAITVVIPFQAGAEEKLGPKVNDTYFGKVPPDYLVVKDNVLFFKGDGTRRGKIGISPARSKGIAGSYDSREKVLTLVTYNVPAGHIGYVNSMWELQKEPFSGDAINSYNDGSPGPGQAPLGPFYELETSSPAAALKPGETLKHVQRTMHLQGAEEDLDVIAKQTLGVSISEIKAAFAK